MRNVDEDEPTTTSWDDAQPRSYPEPVPDHGTPNRNVPARRERRRRPRRPPDDAAGGRGAGLDTILMAVILLILTVAVTYLLLVPETFGERVIAVVVGIAIFGIESASASATMIVRSNPA
jgi:hypothetical protein